METGFFIFQIVVLIGSVVVHEVSHGLAADYLGDKTARRAGRLSLNPVRHLDPVGSFLVPGFLALLGGPIFGWARPVPYNPQNLRSGRWGEVVVAAAGPVSNIVLALAFTLLVRLSGFWNSIFLSFTSVIEMFMGIIAINLSLAVFNLIPIPPLDGSKILFGLLPESARGIQTFIERYGFIVLFIFVAFGGGLIGPIVESAFRFLLGR